ncbi:uncharacterized protein LOC134215037 [Armigeres subalbatus]|uniref:uncharacterized protein LOC134215037 n=1 Tax=Armigeres subalbatus TaxID=124917 RepID=UPI002ED1775D
MAFVIVQTRKNKNSKPCMTVVPAKWAKRDHVYWPPKHLISLSKDVASEPDVDSWKIQKCKIVGQGVSYAVAEDVMRRLEAVTDSEDAVHLSRGTRNNPGKKKEKFMAKTYQLLKKDNTGQTMQPEPQITCQVLPAAATLPDPVAETSATITACPPVTEGTQLSNTAQFIIHSGDGKQFLQMYDGQCLEIVTAPTEEVNVASTSRTNPGESTPQNFAAPMDINPSVAAFNHPNTIIEAVLSQSSETLATQTVQAEESPLLHIVPEDKSVMVILQDLQTRVSRMEAMLEKVVEFMANVNRLFETKKPSKISEGEQKKFEDFSEFEQLLPISTENKLKELDLQLNNQHYADKLYRFFETIFKLNGKREGKSFFRNLIRKLVEPSVLTPFSWLGNTRSKKGEAPVVKNKSFKQDFPTLILFVSRILRSADFEFSAEDTEVAFGQFLRQKNTELKRKQLRSGPAKFSHVKKRRPDTASNLTAPVTTTYNVEQHPNAQAFPPQQDLSEDHIQAGSSKSGMNLEQQQQQQQHHQLVTSDSSSFSNSSDID